MMSVDRDEPLRMNLMRAGRSGPRISIFVVLLVIAVFVGLYKLGVSVDRWHNNPRGIAAMQEQAPLLLRDAFAKMSYQTPRGFPVTSLEPSLVYDGSKADLLLVGRFSPIDETTGVRVATSLRTRMLGEPTPPGIEGLARTPSGRYFVTFYGFEFDSPSDCLKPAACGFLLPPREMTLDQAKRWVFLEESATSEDYLRIFGVPMPPRKVPA